ncbi:MAG TPA: hypothetical protein VNT52_01455 [Acidimicrobiales bacterium]|jgi:hypothetical protein|nr:hypothetical protein [Acidimicrobiales bacterium]
MTDDHARLANLIGPCPECGNGRLQPVVDGEGTKNLLCRDCGSCWHAEFEWSRRVDPLTCPGCPSRELCQTARRPSGPVVPQLT